MLTLILLGLVCCWLFCKYIEPITGWITGIVILVWGLKWVANNYNHFNTVVDIFTKLK